MAMNEENAEVILNAIGMAVIELVTGGVPITKDNLVDRLEHNRRETGNVIGEGANRDAAELVRKGQ